MLRICSVLGCCFPTSVQVYQFCQLTVVHQPWQTNILFDFIWFRVINSSYFLLYQTEVSKNSVQLTFFQLWWAQYFIKTIIIITVLFLLLFLQLLLLLVLLSSGFDFFIHLTRTNSVCLSISVMHCIVSISLFDLISDLDMFLFHVSQE